MSSYPFEVQVAFVPATMALHNFIIKARAKDFDYETMLNNPNFVVQEDDSEPDDIEEEDDADADAASSQIFYSAPTSSNEMDVIRNNMCAHMSQDWQ